VTATTGGSGGATVAAPPAIRFSALHAGYGRIEVLHGIDLEVPGGSVFALLGPNGAGKSTMLKVINGRLAPMSGGVTIEGLTPARARPDVYAHLGVCAIPEGRGVFPNLTVRDNLRIWTYRRGVTRAEVEEQAYARFPRLKERRRQLAGTLSGGEQQMLAISRALVGEPRVLLLDEISMGLAPIIVSELYELVGQIAAGGVTVVLAEQFVTTALGVATRAAIVLNGRIHKEGSPQEMADAALGAYLAHGDG
jgi:branched-chain amino acid transport system ATP-binding protein